MQRADDDWDEVFRIHELDNSSNLRKEGVSFAFYFEGSGTWFLNCYILQRDQSIIVFSATVVSSELSWTPFSHLSAKISSYCYVMKVSELKGRNVVTHAVLD